jgi:hypothetical protein
VTWRTPSDGRRDLRPGGAAACPERGSSLAEDGRRENAHGVFAREARDLDGALSGSPRLARRKTSSQPDEGSGAAVCVPDALGARSTAVQWGPDAFGGGSTAIEWGPDAIASGSTVVERGPDAIGSGSTAVERGPDATASGSTVVERGPDAIGSGSTAVERGPVAIACGPTAVERGPVAIACGPTAIEWGHDAIGSGSTASASRRLRRYAAPPGRAAGFDTLEVFSPPAWNRPSALEYPYESRENDALTPRGNPAPPIVGSGGQREDHRRTWDANVSYPGYTSFLGATGLDSSARAPAE